MTSEETTEILKDLLRYEKTVKFDDTRTRGALYVAIDALKQLEQKKGNWVYKNREKCECSRCGFVLDDWILGAFYNYCPICGALMEAEK